MLTRAQATESVTNFMQVFNIKTTNNVFFTLAKQSKILKNLTIVEGTNIAYSVVKKQCNYLFVFNKNNNVALYALCCKQLKQQFEDDFMLMYVFNMQHKLVATCTDGRWTIAQLQQYLQQNPLTND